MIAVFLASATWVGTWAASPVRAAVHASFAGDTLREAVHVSIGGSQVRIRFTNRFGNTPLVIGDAAISFQETGAQPVVGTMRRLEFMGRSSITIPPRADAYSDPVALKVEPQSTVLVDVYLPGHTPATEHTLAYQTNYAATGDHAGEIASKAFTQTYESWYALAGVDVSGTRARGAVVALGDSITDGAGGRVDANDRWTDFLAARLRSLPPGRQLGILDEGISGNRILLNDARFGENALARFDADVLSQSGAADVIIFLGINDIQQTPHQYDPIRIEQGLQQLVLQAHAHGLRAIGCTITPYEGWLFFDEQGEATRLAVNRFIRSSGTFDAVVDFDAVVRDPQDPHRLLRAFDSGDHLHPNAAAHRVMAGAIDLQTL